MDKLIMQGGQPLSGTIPISGAKNAALPLMTASLLTSEPLILRHVPHLADITTLAEVLGEHGAELSLHGHGEGGETGRVLSITTPRITNAVAPYELVRKMRASILVLGPLLARHGEAKVSLPGGCAIGTRPVDLHLKALEQLGATITLEGGYIHARADNGLRGAHIRFPAISVGATENLLMAASLAEGETILENAAREPEIADLAACLNAMGADIRGAGSETITVSGTTRLRGADHRVIPDRIETGTYALAAAATGGDVTLTGTRPELIDSLTELMQQAGVAVTVEKDSMRVCRDPDRPMEGVDMMTQPYPGFPTDLQAQFMACMATAQGAAMISETIFENRFMHVPELMRMGANINLHGGTALVRGVKQLTGAPVMATDLRASVSLVIAGLIAKGETEINRVYHLDRGYERIEDKLSACGASIRRERV
ncbi:MAG TPA: UDP-N-acetylglucosamine 1-carboxyvinyltransferase [Alphaproteobacteria bacterium]|nr:UDP-N-acetylglucosamine 1-carboxyvinyltransferase [Alphaproteobacteria bacterium]HBC53375.1 UDP-N-acetylglucosamine 1-carboxyvinyltransferase [Alphaproteobacteria bacterium]